MQMECMVLLRAAFVLKNVVQDALPDALLQHTRSHACFSVKSAVPSAIVPPGTYGNKQYCPCYNNWKTKRGGPKCP
ncbi:hypothetical protein CRYUN_Cryun25bG0059300 [Craigia yunnanensis]